MHQLDRYHVGTSVLFSTEVRDEARALVTPTNLRLRLRRGETGTEVVYELGDLTVVGTGLYQRRHIVNGDGIWYWRWESTNPTDADEGFFRVTASEFP